MQIPLLKEHIEKELLEYAKPEMENCLIKTKNDLKFFIKAIFATANDTSKDNNPVNKILSKRLKLVL